MTIRRIITANNSAGRSHIVQDGPPPRSDLLPSGLTTTLLWSTAQMPVPLAADDSDAGDRQMGIPPDRNGTVFRIVEFPPETDGKGADYSYMEDHGTKLDAAARHPGMHKTASIDYGIVLTGEITMLMDDGEVHLKAGDVVVQRATNHAWMNRGTVSCQIAFILIDAHEIADPKTA